MAGKSVVSALIAVEQAVAPEPLPDSFVCRNDARVIGRLVADARHQQETRVYFGAVQFTGVTCNVGIEPKLLDRLSNRFAFSAKPLRQRSQGENAFLIELEQSVEGEPAHELGKRVLPWQIPHFPDAVIGLAPFFADDLAEPGKHAAFDRLESSSALNIGVGREHHFAVDVELLLRIRAVADADGL